MYASGKYAESSLFSMFTLPFVQGNAKSAFSAIVFPCHYRKTAKKFFGNDKNVIGKTVRVDNKQDYVVTGVLKDLPENSTLQFEWLASFEIDLLRYGNNWEGYGPFTYVELDPKPTMHPSTNNYTIYIHRKRAQRTNMHFYLV